MFKKLFLKARKINDKTLRSILRTMYFNLLKKNRFIIYKMDLNHELNLLSTKKSELDIRIMNYKELEQYTAELINLPLEFYMHVIDGVIYCVAVFIRDKIAHISWLYMKGDSNRWFNLKEDEAQINYCFTFPEFRGKGLFPKALFASAEWLKERGFINLFMEVHEGTIFMINSLKKVPEMKRIGILTHWCFFRPKFITKSSGKSCSRTKGE